MTSSTPVWFITGCSTGFGRDLAAHVRDKGWRAVITARDKSRLTDLTREAPDTTLALDLNVNDPDQITSAVAAAHKRFGRIDVLVNNAGYGYQSSAEEGEEKEIRAQFDTNVFALFALTRAVLPIMRAQHSGHIINITSVAGLMGFPGSAYYAASKHAVEGFSDALAKEVEPLGLRVTCVEPGPFRTDWGGRSLKQTASTIADYAKTAATSMQNIRTQSGSQAGDPARAADAMIAITEAPNPPHHFVLGAWGVDAAIAKLKATLAEVEQWAEPGRNTDFPKQ
jgi:NAD(P)-dependent dehydrogenase (short-subunit alcohol dehydrogenase family)